MWWDQGGRAPAEPPPPTWLESIIGARVRSPVLGGTAEDAEKAWGPAAATKAAVLRAEGQQALRASGSRPLSARGSAVSNGGRGSSFADSRLPPAVPKPTWLENMIGARIRSHALGGTAAMAEKKWGSAAKTKAAVLQAEAQTRGQDARGSSHRPGSGPKALGRRAAPAAARRIELEMKASRGRGSNVQHQDEPYDC